MAAEVNAVQNIMPSSCDPKRSKPPPINSPPSVLCPAKTSRSFLPSNPSHNVPRHPLEKWTLVASKGSSMRNLTKRDDEFLVTNPLTTPRRTALQLSMNAQDAVTATRPPNILLIACGRSCVLLRKTYKAVLENPAAERHSIVFTMACAAISKLWFFVFMTLDPLKLIQVNASIAPPRQLSTTLVLLKMTTLPFDINLFLRGPTIVAPTSAAHPPTTCTTHPPAKSMNPENASKGVS